MGENMRIEHRCPECQSLIAQPEAATPVRQAPQPIAKARRGRNSEMLAGPIDLVKLAKSRIRAIDAILRDHAKLKEERETLKRLLDAAEAKPVGTVRVIRAS